MAGAASSVADESYAGVAVSTARGAGMVGWSRVTLLNFLSFGSFFDGLVRDLVLAFLQLLV